MHKLKLIIDENKNAGEVKKKLKINDIDCDVTVEQDYRIITAEFESEKKLDEKKIRSIINA